MKLPITLAAALFPVLAITEQTLLVDPYFSPYMGGNDILFTLSGLAKLEDTLCPEKSTRTVDCFGRAAESILWLCADSAVNIVQHEVFGHGYRLRELGITPSGYTINIASGATYFSPPKSLSLGKFQAVIVAGLEAQNVFASLAKMDWMEKGTVDGRLALAYFYAAQSTFSYTWETYKGNLNNEGNDVVLYKNTLNELYPSSHITTKKLTILSSLNWLDPMMFYSLYSVYYYITEGKPWTFPTIALGENIRYLPNIKVGYAPYAPEIYIENFFMLDTKPLYIYLKGGKRSVGAGFFYDNFIQKGPISLGLHLDLWTQSPYLSCGTIEDVDLHKSAAVHGSNVWGGAASITSRYRLNSFIKLFLELGGKTDGYLPGYSLSNGIVIRGGLSIKDF
jgi:hypothetical protein